MYKYETHMHTYPVSACARVGVRETLEFYKSKGYDGVFITNHFLDGNINIDASESYENKIEFFFSDYEQGLEIGKEIGIKVFCGIEMSHRGTDFLVYGLDKEWFLQNPQIMDMKIKDKLQFVLDNGGYVIHAHPYREARYIDHIRIYPRLINAVEGINACRTELENKMAISYAENYDFPITAGSDNHSAGKQGLLAGVMTEEPIESELDYIERVKNRQLKIFVCDS